MLRAVRLSAPLLALFSIGASAGSTEALNANRYDPKDAIVLLEVDWGRHWPCGAFENAQLLALNFANLTGPAGDSISLETSSRLLARNEFKVYALTVSPGTYALSGYDIKAARSVRDVGHLRGDPGKLIDKGEPKGGVFSVKAGEIVYIGHFGLDCGDSPIPWRYYVDSRASFEEYVLGFRQKYPGMAAMPVRFGLFDTEAFGNGFSLQNPIVP